MHKEKSKASNGQLVYANDTYKVYQIKTGFATIKNFSYMIVDSASKQAAVVDPTWDSNKIIDLLNQLGANLVAILLTHSHFDHTNLANSLAKKFDATVYMSKKEIEFYKFKCTNLNFINDMDIISIGQTDITCLVTPGHTVGGICYLLSDSLFTGDTIFIEGCGMCTTEGGCPDSMYDSVQRIKAVVRPDVHVYPGHSYGKQPGYTLEQMIKINIYFQFDERERFVEFRMRKNQKHLFDFK